MASVRVQGRELVVADMRPRGFFVRYQSGGVDEDIHAEWPSHGSEIGAQRAGFASVSDFVCEPIRGQAL